MEGENKREYCLSLKSRNCYLSTIDKSIKETRKETYSMQFIFFSKIDAGADGGPRSRVCGLHSAPHEPHR